MAVLEDIKVINVDGTPVAVDELSAESQNLVEIYNVFRRDELTAKHELIKVQSALRDVQREIIASIKKAEDEAKDAEETVETVETTEETVETVETTEEAT